MWPPPLAWRIVVLQAGLASYMCSKLCKCTQVLLEWWEQDQHKHSYWLSRVIIWPSHTSGTVYNTLFWSTDGLICACSESEFMFVQCFMPTCRKVLSCYCTSYGKGIPSQTPLSLFCRDASLTVHGNEEFLWKLRMWELQYIYFST